MGGVKAITTMDEFNETKNGDKLVVVDFYADWCGPCKMIGPKVAKMAEVFTDVVFCKVNVDEADDIAAQEGISAMPTFKLYKGGNQVYEVVGASEEKIKQAILDHK